MSRFSLLSVKTTLHQAVVKAQEVIPAREVLPVTARKTAALRAMIAEAAPEQAPMVKERTTLQPAAITARAAAHRQTPTITAAAILLQTITTAVRIAIPTFTARIIRTETTTAPSDQTSGSSLRMSAGVSATPPVITDKGWMSR